MKLLFLALLIVAVRSYPRDHEDDRIVNGRRASIHSLNHQAQLLQNGIQICGAVIIAHYWVLTAGHCIRQTSPKWTITTGSDKVSEGEVHEIKLIFVHPLYNDHTGENDIALILLENPIIFNKRQDAIPLASRKPVVGDVITISGFGKRGTNLDLASSLEATSVRVVDQATCARKYASINPITDGMFCAGETGDSCQGDSGGPGIFNRELVGIVSFGRKCGLTYYPGVYTNVYMYVKWINQIQQQYTPAIAPTFRPDSAYVSIPTQDRARYQSQDNTVATIGLSDIFSAIGEKLSQIRVNLSF